MRMRTRTAVTAAITFYNLLVGGIAWVFDVAETASPKPGDGGLKLLKAVSNVIGEEGIIPKGIPQARQRRAEADQGRIQRHRGRGHILLAGKN